MVTTCDALGSEDPPELLASLLVLKVTSLGGGVERPTERPRLFLDFRQEAMVKPKHEPHCY